jgi:hypothetical protein
MIQSGVMDILASFFDLGNPEVFAATIGVILALMGILVAVVMPILTRAQPKPEIPQPRQLENVKSMVAEITDEKTIVTYTMEDGGHIIGYIDDSLIQKSAKTVDLSLEHLVRGRVLNFTGKRLVIKNITMVSEIDNEVLEHYSWEGAGDFRIIEPDQTAQFTLVFWPVSISVGSIHRFLLRKLLTKVLVETTNGHIEMPISYYMISDVPLAIKDGFLKEDEVPDMAMLRTREGKTLEGAEVDFLLRNRPNTGFGWKVTISVTKDGSPASGIELMYAVVGQNRYVFMFRAETDKEGQFVHLEYSLINGATFAFVLTKVQGQVLWIRQKRCVISKDNPVGRIRVKV